MWSMFAYVCVMYTDGAQHCDVRSALNYSNETQALCEAQGRAGVLKIVSSAMKHEEVQFITRTNSVCLEPQELQTAINYLPKVMENFKSTYTYTQY